MNTHKNEFKDRFYGIKLSIREHSENGATWGTSKVSSGKFIQSSLLIDKFLPFRNLHTVIFQNMPKHLFFICNLNQ